MEGIEKNLHSKNRDRFTHGLSVFRREVNDVLKVGLFDNTFFVVVYNTSLFLIPNLSRQFSLEHS